MVKLNKEMFIEKTKTYHGSKYDYKLVEYKNSSSKIKIICPIHGVFEQTPNSHLTGRGCCKCGHNERIKKQIMELDLFIKKSKLIHGDKYDYSLVEYLNNKKKVILICDKHGSFELKPNCHLTGGGCGRCVGRGKTTEDFVLEAKNIHGDKYDYSLVEYISTHSKMKIICSKHGEFKQSSNQHLNGGGCPICNESKGELEIKKYLTDNNIKFTTQKRFIDCRDIRPLPFDFYLTESNTCIEFNGIQHYEPVNYFGGLNSFKLQEKRDKIKLEYCKNNKIKLIIIRYNDNISNKFSVK